MNERRPVVEDVIAQGLRRRMEEARQELEVALGHAHQTDADSLVIERIAVAKGLLTELLGNEETVNA